MSGPAIKYYVVTVPAADALARLNEAGASGHMLCHMERRPSGSVGLVLAMPRSWDKDPWCPPAIQREIARLQSSMQNVLDWPVDREADDYKEKVSAWIEHISEIMNPKPETDDAEG